MNDESQTGPTAEEMVQKLSNAPVYVPPYVHNVPPSPLGGVDTHIYFDELKASTAELRESTQHYMHRILYQDLGIAQVCETCEKPDDICTCESEADAAFDMLLSQAATPNLAAMFSKAQEQGLVVPKTNYTAHA